MASGDRHSEAQEVELITDPIRLAEAESYNVIKQYRQIEEMVAISSTRRGISIIVRDPVD